MATPKLVISTTDGGGHFQNKSNDYLLLLQFNGDTAFQSDLDTVLVDAGSPGVGTIWDEVFHHDGTGVGTAPPSNVKVLIPPQYIFSTTNPSVGFLALQGSLEDLRGYI